MNDQREARRIKRGSIESMITTDQSSRPARRIRRRTIVAGESIVLSPDDGQQHEFLVVDAPDGSNFRLKLQSRSISLWVPQAGIWSYGWDDGEAEELRVIEAPVAVTGASISQIVPQSMTITRAPRF